MTYDECMARLLACPATKRGERLAWACSTEVAIRAGRALCWDLRASVGYPVECHLWSLALSHDIYAWRRFAAPLRRAREERQEARALFFEVSADNKAMSARIRELEAALGWVTDCGECKMCETCRVVSGAALGRK